MCTEIHYKSPNLKLEFKSYLRAHEFDRMLVKHAEGEEAAALEYMHEVGGYVKLMSYVCGLNKHTFLQEAKVAKQTKKEVCPMFNVNLLFGYDLYILFSFREIIPFSPHDEGAQSNRNTHQAFTSH